MPLTAMASGVMALGNFVVMQIELGAWHAVLNIQCKLVTTSRLARMYPDDRRCGAEAVL